jgi:hypothetical protein
MTVLIFVDLSVQIYNSLMLLERCLIKTIVTSLSDFLWMLISKILFIKIGLKFVGITPSRSLNLISTCSGCKDWRNVTAYAVAFMWYFGASLAIVNGWWLTLRHIKVHAWKFGDMLVLDQHRLGSLAGCVEVLFGLISSGLIFVPRPLGRGEHLQPLLGRAKRCLARWTNNWLSKLFQPPSFKSFGGFASHQRLSAILRCSCYAISDRTLEKISHFGAILSSDESDQRWATPWFILHRFANGMLMLYFY